MSRPQSSASPESGPPKSKARRRTRRWIGVGLGLVALGAVGVAVAAVPGRGRRADGSAGGPFVAIAKTDLLITVRERGDLESARNLDAINEVEGQSTIISILPEGTVAKKGELVCELDSSALRDNLTNQVITTRQAEADFAAAGRTREVAEITVKEYRDGTYQRDMQVAQNDLRLAVTELGRAKDRLEWSGRMLAKGYVTPSQNEADRQAKFNAEIALDRVRTKIGVLATYTRQRSLTELAAAVDKARADELAKQAVFELEKSKQAKLERQIAKCRLVAPADGLVVYANGGGMMPPGMTQPQIMEGATVRERQKIFSLPDVGRMRVVAKIHESLVERIRAGQPASIRVDAYPGRPLTGVVRSVQPVAEPAGLPGSDLKVYATSIDIDGSHPGLRPGMTGTVEILVARRDDALALPMPAVLQYGGRNHVYVATEAGPQLREVQLGAANDRLIEVKQGLTEGDRVALEPMALLPEEEKGEALAGGRLRVFAEGWDERAGAAGSGE